jgi:hypothetical protein
MRRTVTIVSLAALVSGLPLFEAEARDRARYGRPHYYAAPANPWAAWRAYYGAQADLSFARRAYRANHYVARGYNPPHALGPPTNYYAERYALEPYSYFSCPLARRGEGVCAGQAPLSVLSD